MDGITYRLRRYMTSEFKAIAADNPENTKAFKLDYRRAELDIRDSANKWKIKVLLWLS